jgi:hypothetical protein
MERDEPLPVADSLDHREAARRRLLSDERLSGEAESPRRLAQFHLRPRSPHARARGAYRSFEENRKTVDCREVFLVLEHERPRLRDAGGSKGPVGANLVLDRAERIEIRDLAGIEFCSAETTAACSCVGNSMSMALSLQILAAASSQASGSGPKRGTA